ncbi:MAG: ATP-binding protein [Planctomycetia bacterium]
MNSGILLRILGPMGVLSLLLMAVGVVAARHVEQQQQISSDLIHREVYGMLVVEQLYIVMRDIRYELALFLRSHDPRHVENVRSLLKSATEPLKIAKRSARTPEESERIRVVSDGFTGFVGRFDQLTTDSRSISDGDVMELSDKFLTARILTPIDDCIGYNRLVVDRTTTSGEETARQMRLGFLLLGVTGCIAGLFVGIGIARALSRSIVQLDVSVRSMAGKLNEVSGPVQISRLSDLQGVETGIRQLGAELGTIVERLQQRETEILRTEQLATVGQLAAGMAHELRNPLTPVKVLVQAAIERNDVVGLSGKDLRIVNEEVLRLEEAIQSFLDFARPPVIEAATTNISQVIRSASELLASQASRNHVEIRLQLPANPQILLIDSGQLRQVFLNLMLNAMDELPDGGWIEIALRRRSRNITGIEEFTLHDALRAGAAATQDIIEITVTDNGSGIPDNCIERAFEPFFSTKETGTGLGLSICKRIVEAHRGTIGVERVPEGGTRFRILLPVFGPESNNAAPATLPA